MPHHHDRYHHWVKGWETVFPKNGPKKWADINVCFWQNRLQIKSSQKREEEHIIFIKGKIYQEDIAVLKVCAPNTGHKRNNI